jgi:hypothetical protein
MTPPPTVKEVLKANRPKLSEGSLRTYESVIRTVCKQLAINETTEAVIENHGDIIDSLKENTPNVRKTRLSSFVVFIEKDKGADKALEAFRKVMKEDVPKCIAQQESQEKNDKQRDGMIPLKEVMAKYHAWEKTALPLMEKDKLSAQEFFRVQTYVLLSCLLLIDPRRTLDYTAFKIANADESKDNFLKFVKRKPFLVFNTYKTAGKYGQQMVACPPKLAKIILRWKTLNPHDHLLMNFSQTGPFLASNMPKLLNTFFDKPISTSMLRHIFLTDKYKDAPPLKDMNDTATAMGTSVGTMLTYVKK